MSEHPQEHPEHSAYPPELKPHKVPAANGWHWIASGAGLLRAAPMPLIGMAMVWFLIVVALNFVPFFGTLAATILSPVLFGGFMLACDRLRRQEPVTTGDLFSAFSGYGGPLALVGALYLLGLVVVSFIAAAVAVSIGVPPTDPAVNIAEQPALVASLLISVLLSVPLIMALWYAPALVVLERRPPAAAMKLSFRGAAANLPAFVLYLLASMLISLLAALPVLLGFVLWAPIAIASAYAGYRDIFRGAPATAPARSLRRGAAGGQHAAD